MLVVGLTGGIGSGKSEVARQFAALGVEVADADVAAHAVTAVGEPGYVAVLAAFGSARPPPDGNLDRAWLRADRVRRPRSARAARGDPASARPRAARRRGRRVGTEPTASWSCPLLLERGGRAIARGPGAGRRLPGGRAGAPRDAPQRPHRRRSARDHGDATVARQARLAQADDVIDNGGARSARRAAGASACDAVVSRTSPRARLNREPRSRGQ